MPLATERRRHVSVMVIQYMLPLLFLKSTDRMHQFILHVFRFDWLEICGCVGFRCCSRLSTRVVAVPAFIRFQASSRSVCVVLELFCMSLPVLVYEECSNDADRTNQLDLSDFVGCVHRGVRYILIRMG